MCRGRFRERPKRPLEESELMPWHPSVINLTLLMLTQKHWSRNWADVTPRPYSSATCWRWNDMWKTEKACILKLAHRRKANNERWYRAGSVFICYFMTHLPDHNVTNLMQPFRSVTQMSEISEKCTLQLRVLKGNSTPISQTKWILSLPMQTLPPFLRPGWPLCPLLLVVDDREMKIGMFGFFMILHRFTISINGKPS